MPMHNSHKKHKTRPLCLAMAVTALLATSAALAGNRSGAFYATLGEGYYHFSHDRHLENITAPSMTVGYDFSSQFAAQAGVLILNTDQRGHQRVGGAHGLVYQLDGVYRFAQSSKLEPYALAGMQV